MTPKPGIGFQDRRRFGRLVGLQELRQRCLGFGAIPFDQDDRAFWVLIANDCESDPADDPSAELLKALGFEHLEKCLWHRPGGITAEVTAYHPVLSQAGPGCF